jgi:hypothetical protein
MRMMPAAGGVVRVAANHFAKHVRLPESRVKNRRARSGYLTDPPAPGKTSPARSRHYPILIRARQEVAGAHNIRLNIHRGSRCIHWGWKGCQANLRQLNL